MGGKVMAKDMTIRWKWLKGMYLYTLLGAGGFGTGVLFYPEAIKSRLGWSIDDPVALGMLGSILIAFALVSILGLRSPLKFVPVLLLQMCYKTIWFVGVIIPLIIKGQLPGQSIALVIIYVTYIIGDLIAIPFPVIFKKQ